MVTYLVVVIALLVIVGLIGNSGRRSYHNAEPYYNNYYPPPHNHGYDGGKSLVSLGAVVVFGGLLYFGFFKEVFQQNKAGPIALGVISPYAAKPDSTVQKEPLATQEDENIFGAPNEPQPALPTETWDEYNYEATENFPKTDTETAADEGTFYIQTGAFTQLTGAQTELERFQQRNPARTQILVEQQDGFTDFKVLIGPFASRNAASYYKSTYLSNKSFIKDLADHAPHFLN